MLNRYPASWISSTYRATKPLSFSPPENRLRISTGALATGEYTYRFCTIERLVRGSFGSRRFCPALNLESLFSGLSLFLIQSSLFCTQTACTANKGGSEMTLAGGGLALTDQLARVTAQRCFHSSSSCPCQPVRGCQTWPVVLPKPLDLPRAPERSAFCPMAWSSPPVSGISRRARQARHRARRTLLLELCASRSLHRPRTAPKWHQARAAARQSRRRERAGQGLQRERYPSKLAVVRAFPRCLSGLRQASIRWRVPLRRPDVSSGMSRAYDKSQQNVPE
jgi:hypothetical protein